MNYRTPFVAAIAMTMLFGCSLEKVEVLDGLVKEFGLSNASKSFEVGKINEFALNVWLNPNDKLLAVNTNVDESIKHINVKTTIERRSTPGKAVPSIIMTTPATGSFCLARRGPMYWLHQVPVHRRRLKLSSRLNKEPA